MLESAPTAPGLKSYSAIWITSTSGSRLRN